MLNTDIPQFDSGFIRFCLDDTANSYADGAKTVVLAPKLASGTQAPNTVGRIVSYEDALNKAGAGSIAADMCRLFLEAYPEGKLYLLPVEDDAASVAAEYTLTVTGAPTEAGALIFQIYEQDYVVPVPLAATDAQIATAIATRLNGNPVFPFTAAAAAGVVTLVARNKGLTGNNLAVRFNPYLGDKFPDGVTVALAQTVTGAGFPDVTAAVDALGVCQYDLIALGFYAETEVRKVADHIRTVGWACGNSTTFGHLYYGYPAASVPAAVTYASAINDPARSAIPVMPNYHIPIWRFPAAAAARQAYSADQDVSRPVVRDNGLLTGLTDGYECRGLFSGIEKEALADAGLVVWDVSPSGTLWIEENRTFWKVDKLGVPSRTWRFVETRFQLVHLIREVRKIFWTEYGSHALVSNGTKVKSGRRVVTPNILKARLNRFLRDYDGLLIDSGGNFDNMVKVERNTDDNVNGDPDRVDILFDPDLVNQLRRVAIKVRPILQR